MKKLEMNQMEKIEGGSQYSCAIAGATYVIAGAAAVLSGGILALIGAGLLLANTADACGYLD
jgi:hypothetical protein